MSLRVRAPIPAGDLRRSSRNPGMDDPYMSRLVKLVPAEAIGVYPFMIQQAEHLTPNDGSPRYAVYFTAWVLLIIVIVLRWRATAEPGRGAQWGAILISAVAFFIWVHVMKGDFGFETLINTVTPSAGTVPLTRDSSAVPVAPGTNAAELKQFVSNTALVAWTMLSPVVYRGDPEG